MDDPTIDQIIGERIRLGWGKGTETISTTTTISYYPPYMVAHTYLFLSAWDGESEIVSLKLGTMLSAVQGGHKPENNAGTNRSHNNYNIYHSMIWSTEEGVPPSIQDTSPWRLWGILYPSTMRSRYELLRKLDLNGKREFSSLSSWSCSFRRLNKWIK